jgi:hypothetical protein
VKNDRTDEHEWCHGRINLPEIGLVIAPSILCAWREKVNILVGHPTLSFSNPKPSHAHNETDGVAK